MRAKHQFLGGLLVGVGLTYLLDPERGARRRALVRDQASKARRKLGEELDARTRDLRNRAAGSVAELRARFRHEAVSDDVLEERVRSAIGRVVSHPGAIEVVASEGVVMLRGPVLAAEVQDLVRAARGVRGVSRVVNQLEVHQRPDDVPALSG